MSTNRWKVLTCTMAVGLGGLAVFANPPTPVEKIAEPPVLPVLHGKPASPPEGSDTQDPAKLPPIEFELTIPPVPSQKPEVTRKDPALPIIEDIVPVKGESKDPKEAPKSVPLPGISLELSPDATPRPKETLPPATPPAPVAPTPLAPVAPTPLAPVAPVPLPVAPREPNLDVKPPMVPGAPPTPLTRTEPTPLTPTSKPSSRTASGATKLKMLVRIDNGRPRFEIRDLQGEEVLFKAYGDKIEMSSNTEAKGDSPLAGVSAIGKVKFTAPGVEGTCDQLTILSGSGEVLMKGNVQIRTKRGRTWSEMTSEKMVYQIGTTGLVAPSKPLVRPTGYVPE